MEGGTGMKIFQIINLCIGLMFAICYSYQFAYIPLVWILRKKNKEEKQAKIHRYAILICARNEEAVIGDLICSIQKQTYPSEYLHTFVLADNCTDGTAQAADRAGAIVYRRKDSTRIGKGYALHDLMTRIRADYPDVFDGFFVFDADNILSESYVENMNRTFSQGYDIVTSYRNSKNYGSSWVSAGYSLWFLRESRYLNHARFLLGSSCAVSGTGFLFSNRVAKETGPWPYHLLTEDIEFSVDQILKGRTIGFCPDAEFYDEQPITFAQSCRQRLRWCRGYLQVFHDYGRKLTGRIVRGSFSCYDMTMNIMPAFLLSALSVLVNLAFLIWTAAEGESLRVFAYSTGRTLLNTYLLLFGIGTVTMATEWKRISCSAAGKIKSLFTFPLFMATYLPIAMISVFYNAGWKPIEHSVRADQMHSVCSDKQEGKQSGSKRTKKNMDNNLKSSIHVLQ